jgi:hypothetical protein
MERFPNTTLLRQIAASEMHLARSNQKKSRRVAVYFSFACATLLMNGCGRRVRFRAVARTLAFAPLVNGWLRAIALAFAPLIKSVSSSSVLVETVSR